MAATSRYRIVFALVLALLGAALLAYGASFHAATVLAKEGDTAPAVATSEPSLIKEVTVGGVERDEAGQVRKTYGGSEAAPKACPT